MQRGKPETPDDTQLAHDRIADRFDVEMDQYDVTRRLEVLIDDFLSDVDLRGLEVLDAGCGTGRGSEALAGKGARVVSFDIGPHLLEIAQCRCPTCKTVLGSVASMPFEDASFDVVFSSEVIEHTPDPLVAVSEMWRVLRPGGHLVLSTPNRLWQGPVRWASMLRLRPYDGYENFVPASRLRRHLEARGAQVLDHVGLHILPFQIVALRPMLRRMDAFGRQLMPLMINQAIHCVKPTVAEVPERAVGARVPVE